MQQSGLKQIIYLFIVISMCFLSPVTMDTCQGCALPVFMSLT